MLPGCSFWLWAALLYYSIELAFGTSVSFLEQSFFFDWNNPSQPFPVPVTRQCDTIHITWERGTATGPNPVAPYYLQVYTSNFIVPFIISAGAELAFDWPVPFAPNTLYQICMFDSNGNTGGCQGVYTMIPSNSSSAPSCANVTIPYPLQVDATVANGPMSQYGWIDQCSDISLLPRNGTPPYTMTVAPSLHPPYNITSDGSKPLNWTVSLSWASSFFVSIADSAGNVWANGLLHSGEGSSTACLSGLQPTNGVPKGIAIGAGLGGLAVGLITGLFGALLFLCLRDNKKRTYKGSLLDLQASSQQVNAQGIYVQAPSPGPRYQALPNSPGILEHTLGHHTSPGLVNQFGTGTQYQVEPFVLPSAAGDMHPPSPAFSPTRPPSSTLPRSPSSAPDSGAQRNPGQQVYVVHHDGGRAPVTVYTQEGAQVVELPPGYPGDTVDRQNSTNLHARQDVRSMVGSSTDLDSGSSDPGRVEVPVALQQIRKPGNIQMQKQKRPQT